MKPSLSTRILLSVFRFYQTAISPLFAPRCRFLPTCSEYAVQAVQRHGAWCGGWLALRRVCRCHPFHPGGIDEVPQQLSAPRWCRHGGIDRSPSGH